MRIATSQYYKQALSSMQMQQNKLQQTELQVSTGLRILKPSDDPSASVKVLNLNSNIDTIGQYDRNTDVARSVVSHQESVMQGVNDSLQRVRELIVQANNPTNHDGARKDIAAEIKLRLDEITQLANSKDTNGEYLFSGARVDTPPFLKAGGSVVYQGDQNERVIKVGEGASVKVRDSGESVFMNIRGGNGTIQVLPDEANTGSMVIGQFGANSSYVSDTYTVDFYTSSPGNELRYTVSDSASTVISDSPYESGTSISFSGIQFSVTGTPAAGDRVTVQPAQNIDMFTMISDLVESLETPVTGAAVGANMHNTMGQGLANLDQALQQVNAQRATLGARLNTLDSTESMNADFKLQLETVLSDTQDLDYADAIARFNQQLTALEVAQKAFVKTSELSIFRYL